MSGTNCIPMLKGSIFAWAQLNLGVMESLVWKGPWKCSSPTPCPRQKPSYKLGQMVVWSFVEKPQPMDHNLRFHFDVTFFLYIKMITEKILSKILTKPTNIKYLCCISHNKVLEFNVHSNHIEVVQNS